MINLAYYLLLFLHPIHASVTEINFSEKDNALQITSRIFVDDLEQSIRNKRKEPELDILLPKNGISTHDLVVEYLKEHFKVKLDGKLQKLKLLGHEKEDAAIVCYIEIEKVKKFKAIEVFDDILMDLYEDQSNLVHVTYKGPIKSVRLTQDKPSELFTFD
jgi:hypothetical protein